MKHAQRQIVLVVSLVAASAAVRAQDVYFLDFAPQLELGVRSYYFPNSSTCCVGSEWNTWPSTTLLPLHLPWSASPPVLIEMRNADHFTTQVAKPQIADSPSQVLYRVPIEDSTLRTQIAAAGIKPLNAPPADSPQLVELGRMLFHDRILSGNRDISCATCHHEELATGDALSHSIGTGGLGLGSNRRRSENAKFTRRNSPEIFNRGLPQWRTQFWDSRVEQVEERVISPAGLRLPYAFSHVLEVQAMFPVASRDEMRGQKGDIDQFGNHNELALIEDDDEPAIWRALMKRLLSAEGERNTKVTSYRRLFASAYPQKPIHQLGFEYAAIAIAAYERATFTLLDSPWDRYVAGDIRALDPAAKRGASLFFGKARCASCHRGSLLTDQKCHNILVPHIGPTRLTSSEEDLGRFEETKASTDNCAFRTPPLRNVAVTGPWMHNGAYETLDAAIRHHLDPVNAFLQYDHRHEQGDEPRADVQNTRARLSKMLPTLAGQLDEPPNLTDAEIANLLEYLHTMTSPSLGNLAKNVPLDVPSGLPVDGREDQTTASRQRAVAVRASD
jgi:cytochrome c peroxidase